MKLLKATQNKDLKKKRKLPKSEVERHRRERMNRSLESLRALLLKGQHQSDPTCRRVEKAEILEHTVLFLRNTENPVPHEEAEQHPFRHGFLACLKQATQFLKVEGEGQRAGGALTDALSLHRLRPSTHDAATRLSPRPPGHSRRGRLSKHGSKAGKADSSSAQPSEVGTSHTKEHLWHIQTLTIRRDTPEVLLKSAPHPPHTARPCGDPGLET